MNLKSIAYLEEVLKLIRATSKPVEVDGKEELNNQWAEVETFLFNYKTNGAKSEPGGSDKIAAKVREILNEKFPGAELNEDSIANNSNVVLFTCGEDRYKSITID